jgi:hypothetical protein
LAADARFRLKRLVRLSCDHSKTTLVLCIMCSESLHDLIGARLPISRACKFEVKTIKGRHLQATIILKTVMVKSPQKKEEA